MRRISVPRTSAPQRSARRLAAAALLLSHRPVSGLPPLAPVRERVAGLER